MSTILGLSAILYHGVAGTTAATEASNVKDLSLSLEVGTADITTRAARGWRVKKATLKEASVEWGMNYDTTDTFCTTVIQNFITGTALALFISDGNGSGLDADWIITNCSMEQPLEDAVTVSATAEPTMDATNSRAPAWKTGGTTAGTTGGTTAG